MQLIYGHDAEVAEWVGGRIGYKIFAPFVAIGMTDDEKTYCGGVIFNQWNGSNIEFTVAMDVHPTHGLLRALYHYVFIQCNATRLSAHTKRSNKRVRILLPKMGFEPEGIRKRFFGPHKADDAFCFALFPHNAKEKLYGRHTFTAAAA